LESHRIRISHFNRNSGETTDRGISSQQLSYYRKNKYVDGWCHNCLSTLCFAIDTVQSIEILSTPIEIVSPKILDEVLSNCYGISMGQNVLGSIRFISTTRSTNKPDCLGRTTEKHLAQYRLVSRRVSLQQCSRTFE